MLLMFMLTLMCVFAKEKMGEEDCVPLRGLLQHVVLVIVREGDRCLNTDVVSPHSENMQANVSLRVPPTTTVINCVISIKDRFGTDLSTDLDLPFLLFSMISESLEPHRPVWFLVHRQSFIWWVFFWQGNCTNHHSRQSGYGPCTRLETVPGKILFYWFYVGLGWRDTAATLTSRTCKMSGLIMTLLICFVVVIGRLQPFQVHH